MVRTQIQLPDELYEKMRRFAEAREISLAEVVRRGLEQFLTSYPPPEDSSGKWQMPSPRKLGCRPMTAEQLRDISRGDEELPDWLAKPSRKK